MRVTDARTWKNMKKRRKIADIRRRREPMNRRDGRRRTRLNGCGFSIRNSRQTPRRRKETASMGSRQPREPEAMKEKMKEQTEEKADQVNPAIGNRLHTKAAPTPTYARPDERAVAGGRPERQGTRRRLKGTRGANTSKENQEIERAKPIRGKKHLGNKQPCRRQKKETKRQEPQWRRHKIRHKCGRKLGNGGLKHSRKQEMKKTAAYPSTYAAADIWKGETGDTVHGRTRNG